MTNHRSRRWFQLSLKSLFLLTLLVATFFAGYTLRVKQEEAERRQAQLEAQRKGDELRRQSAWADVLGTGGPGFAAGDFDSNGRIDVTITNPQQPTGVYRNLGDGKYQDVTGSAGLSR